MRWMRQSSRLELLRRDPAQRDLGHAGSLCSWTYAERRGWGRDGGQRPCPLCGPLRDAGESAAGAAGSAGDIPIQGGEVARYPLKSSMNPSRKLPTDPLHFICKCVIERRILWTYHVNMQMRGRAIPREAILETVETFEILESYPEDKYLPSYLVYARHRGEVVHILFATDVPGQNVRVVTSYRPDPVGWSKDRRTRRKP